MRIKIIKPRQCAALIVLRRLNRSYEMLMTQRTQGISFSGAYTAPGGHICETDSDPRWQSILNLSDRPLPSPPYAVESDENTLKICALRETFEETGMFIGKGSIENRTGHFVEDCLNNNAIPSIDGIKFFMRYISPESLNKRFDTSYFVRIQDQELQIVLDEAESNYYEWGSPSYFLDLFTRREISLFAPQVYLLCFLNTYFQSLDDITKFRSNKVPIMAQEINKKLCYPGDYRHGYTEDPEDKNVHELVLNPPKLEISQKLRYWV